MRRGLNALAVLALLSLATIACGDSRAETTSVPGSFYIEATAEVANPGEETDTTAIRWWFEPPRRWRWELATDRGLFFGLSDGETLWIYEPVENTYARAPLPPGFDRPFLPISIQIGPAHADSVDAFIEVLIERTEGFAERVGEESLLGHQTVIVEYGPLFSSTSNDREGVTRSGVGRMWIDPETMLILRHEIGDGSGPHEDSSIVVTRLDLNGDLADELFEFEPPPGAERRE